MLNLRNMKFIAKLISLSKLRRPDIWNHFLNFLDFAKNQSKKASLFKKIHQYSLARNFTARMLRDKISNSEQTVRVIHNLKLSKHHACNESCRNF